MLMVFGVPYLAPSIECENFLGFAEYVVWCAGQAAVNKFSEVEGGRSMQRTGDSLDRREDTVILSSGGMSKPCEVAKAGLGAADVPFRRKSL